MLVCSACNATNPDDHRFCGYCGTRLTDAPAPVSPAGVSAVTATLPPWLDESNNQPASTWHLPTWLQHDQTDSPSQPALMPADQRVTPPLGSPLVQEAMSDPPPTPQVPARNISDLSLTEPQASISPSRVHTMPLQASTEPLSTNGHAADDDDDLPDWLHDDDEIAPSPATSALTAPLPGPVDYTARSHSSASDTAQLRTQRGTSSWLVLLIGAALLTLLVVVWLILRLNNILP